MSADEYLIGVSATSEAIPRFVWWAKGLPLPRSQQPHFFFKAEEFLQEVSAQHGLKIVGSPVTRVEPCGRWRIVVRSDAMATAEDASVDGVEVESTRIEPDEDARRWNSRILAACLLALIVLLVLWVIW